MKIQKILFINYNYNFVENDFLIEYLTLFTKSTLKKFFIILNYSHNENYSQNPPQKKGELYERVFCTKRYFLAGTQGE